MGYLTNYSMDVLDKEGKDVAKEVKINIISDFRKESENANYCFDENGDYLDSDKWYSWEQDSINFSKKYPNFIIKLHGAGEEYDDFWIAYICDGVIQHCPVKFVYEDLDLDNFVKKRFEPRKLIIKK